MTPQPPITSVSSPATFVLKALSTREQDVIRHALNTLLDHLDNPQATDTDGTPTRDEVQALLDALPRR